MPVYDFNSKDESIKEPKEEVQKPARVEPERVMKVRKEPKEEVEVKPKTKKINSFEVHGSFNFD